ncbi:MAG: IS256 family transposase ISCysp27 [Planctomycetes bacterium]|nr:IS256 family transposase ISCysp27 [Planctomycetota bacterium]MCG3134711.1 IS256 family transposase ISCysp27 [Planctomycetota bacterium]
MSKGTEQGAQAPAATVVRDVLTEIARAGAKKMLAQALEDEVAAYIAAAVEERDERGRRLVVRNGHAQEREVQTGLGPVPVRAPRVRDGRTDGVGEPVRYTSKILPPYLRKTRSVEELLPWLYLSGVSTNGFQQALASIFGPDAPGLSSRTIVRLKEVWEEEYEAWTRRPLGSKRYVYLWVDGVHVNVRLTGERACILVVIGATSDGEKVLLAVHDGVRESEESWKDVLLSLRDRGMTVAPELAIGDGALGFWAALPKVFPTTREQRCWVHKTANVLNKLPKTLHPEAKRHLHQIWMAESRANALRALASFGELFRAKYPKAVECVEKDRDALLAFYDFPAEHWKHLRTTNPIESTFSTVRLRTDRTKGSGSRIACLTMVFKLCQSAERSWRRLDAVERLGDLVQGVRFQDGIKVAA